MAKTTALIVGGGAILLANKGWRHFKQAIYASVPLLFLAMTAYVVSIVYTNLSLRIIVPFTIWVYIFGLVLSRLSARALFNDTHEVIWDKIYGLGLSEDQKASLTKKIGGAYAQSTAQHIFKAFVAVVAIVAFISIAVFTFTH